MSCDRVEKNTEKFVVKCHILQTPLKRSPLKTELFNLANYAKKLKPTFSAAGFFPVNQLILARIFSMITTYAIICIQFNR